MMIDVLNITSDMRSLYLCSPPEVRRVLVASHEEPNGKGKNIRQSDIYGAFGPFISILTGAPKLMSAFKGFGLG